MASRGKAIFLTAAILAALIAGALFYLSSNLNGIVAALIEKQGSAATGSSVEVAGVDIRISDASASLAGLTVANPNGFSGTALELGEFSVTLDASSLTSDTIIVKEVMVDGAKINVLQQGAKNNLRELQKSLQAGIASEDADADTESSKKLIIERFTLSDASASVALTDLEQLRTVELPTLVLTDIGKASGGATGAQVAEQILKPLIESAMTSATAGAIKEKVGEKVNEAMGGLLKGLSKKSEGE